jgi:uncharacterized protein YneF (UPF0154 family)
MEWIIASLSASFVFGITIGYFIAKHNFATEQLQREVQMKNNEVWMEYIKTLGGAK